MFGACVALIFFAIEQPDTMRGQESRKIVMGHQMAALPRYGGNTTVEQMREEVRQWNELGLDAISLYEPFLFQESVRRYHEAALQEGGVKIALAPGFMELPFFLELMNSHFRDAEFFLNGELFYSGWAAEPNHLPLILAAEGILGLSIHWEPHAYSRSFDGGTLLPWDLGRVVGSTLQSYGVLMSHPDWSLADGFAGFDLAESIPAQADLIRWIWESARSHGRSARGGIVAHYKGYAHKGNWMVYESLGYARLQACWLAALDSGIPGAEFITLNDMSESSYINSWAEGDPVILVDHWNVADNAAVLDHSGFRHFSKRYVEWFKTGVEPAIVEDELYYAYRLHPRDAANYSDLSPDEQAALQGWIPAGQDPTMIYRRDPVPGVQHGDVGINWGNFSDGVHVAVRLTAPADVFINGAHMGHYPAGEHLITKPGEIYNGYSERLGYDLHTFGWSDFGHPTFEIRRDGQTILAHTGELEITPYAIPGCWNMFARKAPAPAVQADWGTSESPAWNPADDGGNDDSGWEEPDTSHEAAVDEGSHHVEPSTEGYADGGSSEHTEWSENASGALTNASTRGRASGGESTMIGGFVVAGDTARPILIRAIGPTLADYGLGDALPRTQLDVFGPDGLIASTTWGVSEEQSWELQQAVERIGTFHVARDRGDSSMLLTLPPGTYTTHLSNPEGNSGLALMEVYEAVEHGEAVAPAIVNLSTRGEVGQGSDVLIAGFTIEGNAPVRVLIRGIGRGLESYGIADALEDAELVLFAGETPIASNHDWTQSENADEMAAVAQQVHAFELSHDAGDAAMLLTLEPGTYTVHLGGAGGSTGIGLIEIYHAP